MKCFLVYNNESPIVSPFKSCSRKITLKLCANRGFMGHSVPITETAPLSIKKDTKFSESVGDTCAELHNPPKE